MDQSEIKISDLQENDKVKNLKIKIEEKTQIPPDRQRLIYQGKQLKDDQEMLSDYNIKDDTVIHMVAKRQIDQTEEQNIAQEGSVGQPVRDNGVDIVDQMVRTFNESNQSRIARRQQIFQQNARAHVHEQRFDEKHSLGVLQRAINSIENMMSSKMDLRESRLPLNALIFQQESSFDQTSQFQNLSQFNLQKNGKHEVGEWVDVKDTVGQWLEAQVMELREGQIKVHYNGWAERWDEWIDSKSPRVAYFRQYTVQSPNSKFLSPYPNIDPEISINSSQTLKGTIKSAKNIVSSMYQMFEKFEAMCDNPENDEVIHEASLLAPIIDRVGRMMTDLSPHLTNIVFKHQRKLQEETRLQESEHMEALARISTQIPLLHSPGELHHIFEDADNQISRPSIEFHIHAFMNQNTRENQQKSEIGTQTDVHMRDDEQVAPETQEYKFSESFEKSLQNNLMRENDSSRKISKVKTSGQRNTLIQKTVQQQATSKNDDKKENELKEEAQQPQQKRRTNNMCTIF